MVTLPPEFAATKFPGYFWDTETKTLWSLKISGILRPLKITRPDYWNKLEEPAYRVSVNGRRRLLKLSYLNTLTLEDAVIPMLGS